MHLIQIYIREEGNHELFEAEFLPTLKGLVEDYQQGTAESRDPEVLVLFATIFKHMGNRIQEFLHTVALGLCESTLETIKQDMVS